jgi:uncharacterized protein (DUF1499 family)
MNQTPNTPDQKTPGLVKWLGYLAITMLLVLPLAVFTVRSGAWQQGLLIYAIGCLGSALMVLLAVVLLLLPRLFTAAAKQRGEGSNSLEIDSDTLAQQAQAYPELKTLVMKAPYDYVYEKAEKTAKTMGWKIYRQSYNSGVMEAVDTTSIMNFKDDIVIRIRTNEEGTLVDLRSVSRVGLGDMGANAARINAFLERMMQD